MIKMNSKKAMAKIRAYIIDNYDPSGYDIAESNDFSEIATNIMDTFLTEKVYGDNRGMSRLDLFFEWMAGLPSILNAEYIYGTPATEILGDILEETEDERNRYSEMEAEHTMSYLIWRELEKARKA